jgi:uncharacterized phage protein (TIGR01671 family)
MREIKFRIWNVDANCWIALESNMKDITWLRFNKFNVNNLIFQQFTGLKDRNGQNIYEGDLINFSWQVDYGEFCDNKNQEVFYNNESACFVFGKDIICMLDRVVYDTLEVVGNVFENPELL